MKTIHTLNKKQNGFTLIETMVAVSIFAIVVTIGIASLLTLNTAYKSTRKDRGLIDGVSGAIEQMAREIKTGYQYACDPIDFTAIAPAAPDGECSTFGFIATGSGETHKVIYSLEGNVITLFADDGVQQNPIAVTPGEVIIDNLIFTLVENEIGGGQPYVVIRIDGKTDATDEGSAFSLQTMVTQRFPDSQ